MAENAVPKFNVEAFNPKKAELVSLVEKYKDLKIDGVDDKDGLEKVRKARIELKNTRCDIKNKLKEARDPAIAFQNAVLQLEKDLIEIIEPTEEALDKEEKRIEAEKARIKREAEEKELKRLQEMVDKLAAVGYPSSVNALKDVSEAEFETLLADVTKKRNEANRVAAEASAKAEADRKALAEAQAKLEADRKKLAEEQAKIEADKKANEEMAAKLAEDQKKLEEERKIATVSETAFKAPTPSKDSGARALSLFPKASPEAITENDTPAPEFQPTPDKRVTFKEYLRNLFVQSYFGTDDAGPDAEAKWFEMLSTDGILDHMAEWYATTNEPMLTEPGDDYDKTEAFVRQLA
ncbi:MAG: hypothetical protein WA194_09180 [Patescibacteria group bacterium]